MEEDKSEKLLRTANMLSSVGSTIMAVGILLLMCGCIGALMLGVL